MPNIIYSVGTAYIYAVSILDSIKVESNRITVSVTINSGSIRRLLEGYIESEE